MDILVVMCMFSYHVIDIYVTHYVNSAVDRCFVRPFKAKYHHIMQTELKMKSLQVQGQGGMVHSQFLNTNIVRSWYSHLYGQRKMKEGEEKSTQSRSKVRDIPRRSGANAITWSKQSKVRIKGANCRARFVSSILRIYHNYQGHFQLV